MLAAADQIRTIVRAFRDKVFTEIFPGRTEVPKTLSDDLTHGACERFEGGGWIRSGVDTRGADTRGGAAWHWGAGVGRWGPTRCGSASFDRVVECRDERGAEPSRAGEETNHVRSKLCGVYVGVHLA